MPSLRSPLLHALGLLTLSALLPARLHAFQTVVIDAGHGGSDRGGIPGQHLCEKDLTLDVARRLRENLDAAGFKTVMTRSSDATVPLAERVAVANRQRDALFVSIHFNAALRHSASGIETYYYAPAAGPIAARIHRELVTTLPHEENRGVKQHRYFVLRKTRIPAVLAECGFLTNGSEGARCLKPAHRQCLADAIAAGIKASASPATKRG
jgi:N-acetylmuramoyl-L-alanine amidase